MSTPAPKPANQPLRFRRNPNTGLELDREYRYTEEGLIDWRAMVPPQYLYVASEHEAKVVAQQGKPIGEIDILAVPDEWLRIRVAGLNYLAHLRGVRSCTYPTFQATDTFASAVCQMTFIGNVETGMCDETWSGAGSARRTSMDLKMLPYMETFAENRAFGRCVKRALQINILSDIETGGKGGKANEEDDLVAEAADSVAPSGFEPNHHLADKCRAQKVTFEALRTSALRLYQQPPEDVSKRLKADPATWTSFDSIQGIDAWLLMGKLDEAAAAKAAETSGGGKKGKKAAA